MKLIKCPKCGEMYSDSYRTCPFCQEDEALKGRAAAPRRKVTRRRRAPSILGPAMVLVVVLAAVLVGVLLFGGKGNAEKPDDPAVVEPDPAPTTPLTLDQTTLNLNQAETATLRRRLPVRRLHRQRGHSPAGAAQGEAGPALYLSGQGRDHQRVLRQGRHNRPDARGRHGADRHLDH